MNLHRVEGKPEWADLKPGEMNTWQKVAARSGGIITIGNYFSLLGLLSVPFGLLLIIDSRYLAGVLVLLLGRFCDMLDGFLADKTGTKSPLGEKVDAVFDKASTALAVVVLGAGGLVPLWALALIILPHAIVGIIALVTFARGLALHPSRYGKLSMAAGWLALLAFVAVYAFHGIDQMPLRIAAHILLIASSLLGVIATIGYIKEYRRLQAGS